MSRTARGTTGLSGVFVSGIYVTPSESQSPLGQIIRITALSQFGMAPALSAPAGPLVVSVAAVAPQQPLPCCSSEPWVALEGDAAAPFPPPPGLRYDDAGTVCQANPDGGCVPVCSDDLGCALASAAPVLLDGGLVGQARVNVTAGSTTVVWLVPQPGVQEGRMLSPSPTPVVPSPGDP